MSNNMDINELLRNHPAVEAIDALVIDVNGNALGKRVPIRELEGLLSGDMHFSACSLILDARGIGHGPGGLGGPDGDPDGTATLVPSSLVVVPWSRRPTAQAHFEMRDADTLQPLWWDPRHVLRTVVERLHSDGLYPVVACELEFYLIDPKRSAAGTLVPAAGYYGGLPATVPSNLSLEILEEYSDVLTGIRDAAVAQNLPVSSAVAEYGVGQFEINLTHCADPVAAADHACLLRRVVKGVARQHGFEATFMPKPFRSQPGSGLHVHCSLVDANGRNLFGQDGGDRLLQSAVGGMQAMTIESLGLFAPHFNAHRRYRSLFVPRNLAWGVNNRSVAFRVPVSGPNSRRIEHRVAGADASPHLTVAAILSAMHHGISNRLNATAPTEAECKEVEPAFDSGLLVSLTRLEAAALLSEYIPARYLNAYVELKRGEYGDLVDQIMPSEVDFYL